MAKKPIQQRNNERETQAVVQSVYEVSYQPKIDQAVQKLPQAIQQELDRLYEQIAKAPARVIPRLLELQQQYPKVMLINNYLVVAYSYVDKEQQVQCIRENYRRHPTYLFARCHYAQHCLDQGEPDRIPAIFDHKFDLKALYPRRSRFHITEYLAFMQVLCLYFNAVGEREKAEKIYQGMRDAAPDAEETQYAKRALYPGLLRRLGNKIKASLAA